MARFKLGVVVARSYDLNPKDGQGSASFSVMLSFDPQPFHTPTKEKNLNPPVWNESFYFNVSDPSNIRELILETYVYSVSKSGKGSKSFLGTVRICGASFLSLLDDSSIKTLDPSPPMDGVIWCPGQVSDNMESILYDQCLRPHDIPLQRLKEITNNFSEERILGQGGSSVVYKGVQQNGEIIAVKKIVSFLMPGLQKNFENEVYHLMMLKHPNIVRFIGYCYEIHNVCLEYNGKYVFAEMMERMLCLEYLPKGSLENYLSDANESSILDWRTRYKIIEGICNGLCHLHEQIDKPIIHLDLKPANILLDDSFVPKIADFGLSRLLDQQKTICTSSRDGTFGYMAPEFLHEGKITTKSDIFSLGVIILEVVTGHREYPDVKTSSKDFIELELEKWRIVLQRLPGYGSIEMDYEQIKRCIRVGLICVNPNRNKRPPIGKVISMLQGSEGIDCNFVDNEMEDY